MCHLILLFLPHSNQQIIIISIILFCGSYRFCFYPVNGTNQIVYITNHTEKILSKLKSNDEIIILGILIEPVLFIDLIVDNKNKPLHLKFTDIGIIFNSMKNGFWLDEIELKTDPLIVNISFVINIFIDANENFNMSVNGQKFIQINKRESLENVEELRIYGNFTLKSVKIIQINEEVTEDNSMKTFIIGIAITSVLLIITGICIFYILRRHRTHSSKNGEDSTIESLKSSRSNKTNFSNMTHLTGNTFLS